MLSFYTYDSSTLLLLLVLGLAVLMDARRRRIPNYLTYGAIIIGLSMQATFIGMDGFYSGLKGMGIGLLVLIPFYLTGGMGAGDVKLMAAVGTFVGPSAVFQSSLFALTIGGCVALFLIVRSGEVVSIYRRYLVMVTARTFVPAEPGSVTRYRFPFSSGIALGVLVQQGITGKLEFYHLTTQVAYQLQALGVMQ